jgi:hypothetical protein
MALYLTAHIQLDKQRFGPGDEEAFSKVADAKVIANLKERGILAEQKAPQSAGIEEPKPQKKAAAKKSAAKDEGE